MKCFLYLFILSFSTSCALFKSVDKKVLDDKKIVGNWVKTDESGSSLNIYCSGAFNMHILKRPLKFTFDNPIKLSKKSLSYKSERTESKYVDVGVKEKIDGANIKKITGNQIILGPVIPRKVKVLDWPYQSGGKTYFKIKTLSGTHKFVSQGDRLKTCH